VTLRRIWLWTTPLLILPSLLFTALLHHSLSSRKNAGWVADHLQDTQVNDILIDAQGRVWTATDSGVSVYDGTQWTTYSARDDGLPGDRTRHLLLDHQGDVWVLAHRGVSVFDGARWTTFTSETADLPPNASAVGITLDRQHRVWLYWDRAGISVFDHQAWTTYTTKTSGLVDNRVSTMAFDDQNRAWIGTIAGLSVFDGETWTAYTAGNSGLLHDHISAIGFDRRGRAWIGAQGELSVFDGLIWASYPIDRTPISGNSYGGPYAIAFDDQNRAWIGVQGGLNVLDAASGEMILQDNETTVNGVLFDIPGQVWISPSRSTHLRVLDGESWVDYSGRNSALPGSIITALDVDHTEHIWIGSRKGIRVVDLAVARPLSDRQVAVLWFLSWGGHVFVPAIIAGLWLGLWLRALPGVSVGIAVGLSVFAVGIVASSQVWIILGCMGTVAGVVGGLIGSIVFRRKTAPRPQERPAAESPSPPRLSALTGIFGGASCAIIGMVALVLVVVLICIAMLFVMIKLGIGMQ
jgi:Two component regulator propeller